MATRPLSGLHFRIAWTLALQETPSRAMVPHVSPRPCVLRSLTSPCPYVRCGSPLGLGCVTHEERRRRVILCSSILHTCSNHGSLRDPKWKEHLKYAAASPDQCDVHSCVASKQECTSHWPRLTKKYAANCKQLTRSSSDLDLFVSVVDRMYGSPQGGLITAFSTST
jgi:hypothetical protein